MAGMRNTQDLFTERLEALALKLRLTFVNDRQWANTGVFRLLRQGTFTPVLEFRYSFQDNYLTIHTAHGHYPKRWKSSYAYSELDTLLAIIEGDIKAGNTEI